MDATCLQYTLTEEERRQFDEDGFFIVRDVLPLDLVALSSFPSSIASTPRPGCKRGWKSTRCTTFSTLSAKTNSF